MVVAYLIMINLQNFIVKCIRKEKYLSQYAEANFKKSYGIHDKYYHSKKGYTLRDHNQQYLKSPLSDQILLSKSPQMCLQRI